MHAINHNDGSRMEDACPDAFAPCTRRKSFHKQQGSFGIIPPGSGGRSKGGAGTMKKVFIKNRRQAVMCISNPPIIAIRCDAAGLIH